jgi:DinB family
LKPPSGWPIVLRTIEPMWAIPVLEPFYEGWATHQRRLLAAIADLDEEQLALRPDRAQMSIWQLASHMAGSRAYWFHEVLGEGDPAIRDMFGVASTTVPGLSLEFAGWRTTRPIRASSPS